MEPWITNYADIQQNEIDALSAIFMDDFKEGEDKVGAWNKVADRSFTLNLRSSSTSIADLCVKLGVTLPITYPKTKPRFHLEFGTAVRVKPTKRIQDVIELTPPKLIGTEMVFTIATEIQDILEDAVHELIKETPNLDQERTLREASAEQIAERAGNSLHGEESSLLEETEISTLEQAVHLKDSRDDREHHSDMVLEHTKQTNPVRIDTSCVEFDKPVDLIGMEYFQGGIAPFRKVFHRVPFSHGPATNVYTVLPEDSLRVPTNFLILKECVIKLHTSTQAQDREVTKAKQNMQKKAVHSFEDKLNQFMHAERNELIANVLNFRVQQMFSSETGLSYGWNISILVERATFGSLHDILESIKMLDIKIAKPWILDIASGIKWLHQQGFAHGRLHPRNILLMSQSGRPMTIKICDGYFQDFLYKVNSNSKFDYNMARSTFWIASETLSSREFEPQKPTDIWDFGVLMLQMLFGLDVQRDYDSPDALIDAMHFSHSFEDLMSQIFMADYKKRLDAFGLTLHRFFVVENPLYRLHRKDRLRSRTGSSSLDMNKKPFRSRRHSNDAEPGQSRYAQDFEQEMKLGKGGFGAVYMARNRLENRIYAIKKIVQSSASALEPILKEVRFLSQLNHPNVVRYFTAWMESDPSGPRGVTLASEFSDDYSDDESISSSKKPDTSGLDYISSSGRADLDFDVGGDDDDDETATTTTSAQAAVVFGYDDDAEVVSKPGDGGIQNSSASEGDVSTWEGSSSTPPVTLLRRPSISQPFGKTTLYIQMEYCKNKTLRDLIAQDLHLQTQDCWRLFRQILEGLSHIHQHGIIHRDLKPENIFIDVSNNAKIGDYGLAANVGFQPPTHSALAADSTHTILTQSIGTSIYVAPEVKSTGGGKYNEKADIYSLGVIFFEMCCPLETAMERAIILGGLQKSNHTLPSIFQRPNKVLQGQVIELLVAVDPIERPSGLELLQSGKLPVEMVDETIRTAIRSISDTNDPNHKTFMSALFSSTTEAAAARQRLYRLPTFIHNESASLLQTLVKEQLISVFRRHGAVEEETPLLLPKSSLYDDSAVSLLDNSGTLLQLPYDLTFPTATALASQAVHMCKTYTFGNVFRREVQAGHPPHFKEVAFTILSPDSLDLGLRQAETLKVMDEILDAFPNLSTAQVYYHINHSRILDHILDFCAVKKAKWRKVKDVLSKLDGFHYTWANIRALLHSPNVGVPASSLDSLEQFNIRGTHEEITSKLRALLINSATLESTFSHLEAILQYLGRFRVKRKIFVNVLSCVNQKFYEKNFMFQCIIESKQRRDVIAAGGRIDELVLRQYHGIRKDQIQHAVGFSLGWGSIVTSMARYLRKVPYPTQKGSDGNRGSAWVIRRCDVLVNSFEETSLRTIGLSLLSDLWANGISAELVIDTDEEEHFLHRQARSRDGAPRHGWIASVKQDGTVKIRSILKKEETDVRIQEVPHFLRNEIQERDRNEAKSIDKLRSSKLTSYLNPGSGVCDRESNVIVITSQTKGKKFNRQSVISDAQLHAHELVQGFSDLPIVAIETMKETFDGIHDTRFGDDNSWKIFIQNSPVSERQYLSNVQSQLQDLAKTVKTNVRAAIVYNFRTKGCVLYDLGKVS